MAAPQDRLGQQMGEYRLLRLLGKGAFGAVYLTEHVHDDSQAAAQNSTIPTAARHGFNKIIHTNPSEKQPRAQCKESNPLSTRNGIALKAGQCRFGNCYL